MSRIRPGLRFRHALANHKLAPKIQGIVNKLLERRGPIAAAGDCRPAIGGSSFTFACLAAARAQGRTGVAGALAGFNFWPRTEADLAAHSLPWRVS